MDFTNVSYAYLTRQAFCSNEEPYKEQTFCNVHLHSAYPIVVDHYGYDWSNLCTDVRNM